MKISGKAETASTMKSPNQTRGRKRALRAPGRYCGGFVRPLLAAVWAVFLLGGRAWPARPPKADLVLTGGTVRTGDPARPVAEAVAVRDGRIVLVGTAAEAAKLVGPATRRIELHGAVAYPGFVDAHAHVKGLGDGLAELDLSAVGSEAEAVEKVLAAVVGKKPGEWVVGRGWDQNRWPGKQYPSRQSLTRAAPHNPVLLDRVDGHAAWANDEALRQAGLTGGVPRVAGGEILVDEVGRPTGILIDEAVTLVASCLPPAGPTLVRERLRSALMECARLGLTGIHDAGVSPIELDEYRQLLRAKQLPVRVWAMLVGTDAWLEEQLGKGARSDSTRFLTLGAVKAYADGALGSRGAWLLAPYADRPDSCGLSVVPPTRLKELAVRCAAWKVQLCTHAIGDRAVRETLDAYEKALAAVPNGKGRRFRVEHAQVTDPVDLPRFAALGVIPAMQPTHCTSDMPWAPERLGPERAAHAYTWRAFLDTGVHIPAGTDFPVEPANPLFTFYAAVTRQDRGGMPPGGWNPGQRMTREEALQAMTRWPAEAAFQEKLLGSLEVGKLADLTVLDRDLLIVPAEEILQARVLYTIVQGNVVYQAR